jgi:hypothetical protein
LPHRGGSLRWVFWLCQFFVLLLFPTLSNLRASFWFSLSVQMFLSSVEFTSEGVFSPCSRDDGQSREPSRAPGSRRSNRLNQAVLVRWLLNAVAQSPTLNWFDRLPNPIWPRHRSDVEWSNMISENRNSADFRPFKTTERSSTINHIECHEYRR